MATEDLAFDELPSTVGRVIVGDAFTIGEEDSEHFQRATWLDKAYPGGYAEEFPETLVEGFHLLAMLDAVARFANERPDTLWA